jgi:hypothetical protein
MYIKLAIIAFYSLILIVGTWEVQNWRWEAKQLAAVQVSDEMHTEEAKTAATADTKFQTQKGKTDAKFGKIDEAVNKAAAAPGAAPGAVAKCFDPVSLQLLNTAFARTPSAARRLADPLPGLAPPQ